MEDLSTHNHHLSTQSETKSFGFVLQKTAQDCKARSGLFSTKTRGEISTPQWLMYTRLGPPVNLTPDLLENMISLDPSVSPLVFQVSLQELILNLDSIKKFNKGLHGFTSTKDAIFFSVRDPAEYVETTVSGGFKTIITRSGRKKVTPKDFVEILETLRPDFSECISVDVSFSTVTKRMRKSLDVSLSWLDECLKLGKEKGITDSMFGVIQGGSDILLRTKSAQETAKREVAGFVLGSFGLGETQEQRGPVIDVITNELPAEKVRLIIGVGSPEEVLQSVELGVDLFSTNYPSAMTEGGYALTFPLYEIKSDIPFKIELKSEEYRMDKRAPVEDCKCYTCVTHTRAYLHHLLNTNEMLVNTLLTIHNDFHYLQFFKIVRQKIASGEFKVWKNQFLNMINTQNSNNSSSSSKE